MFALAYPKALINDAWLISLDSRQTCKIGGIGVLDFNPKAKEHFFLALINVRAAYHERAGSRLAASS